MSSSACIDGRISALHEKVGSVRCQSSGTGPTSHQVKIVLCLSAFLKDHGLEGCMSRRGNCHDNAVAESFFQLLKRERIKRKSMQPEMKPEAMSLITSSCSTTVNTNMVPIICCHRQSMRTVTKNDWKVSRLLVAMQERHIQLTFHRI